MDKQPNQETALLPTEKLMLHSFSDGTPGPILDALYRWLWTTKNEDGCRYINYTDIQRHAFRQLSPNTIGKLKAIMASVGLISAERLSRPYRYMGISEYGDLSATKTYNRIRCLLPPDGEAYNKALQLLESSVRNVLGVIVLSEPWEARPLVDKEKRYKRHKYNKTFCQNCGRNFIAEDDGDVLCGGCRPLCRNCVNVMLYIDRDKRAEGFMGIEMRCGLGNEFESCEVFELDDELEYRPIKRIRRLMIFTDKWSKKPLL